MGTDHITSNQNFVHLHLHTEYSLLDGFAQIKRVVKYAKELGMPALGISDHGTMFGVIDFYRACKSAGIKPVIGVEAYLARRTRFDRDPKEDAKPYHMLLLARNRTGYQNLLRLSSEAQLNGYYYRPRIDRDLMAAHSEGVIATSGCLAAEIPRMVVAGEDDKARELIGWYQDVFGKENFFLELQSHNIPELETVNEWLFDNAAYANVPLVATNDVHYVRPDDFDPHDTLLCIQTSSLKNDTQRMQMSGGNSYYLRTQQEMVDIFGQIPGAIENSLLIAEMVEDIGLDDNEYHLPIFPVPPQFEDAAAFLRYLCEKGLGWRYGGRAQSAEIQDRLNHELNIIHDMGFDTYFLIVWDLCEFARSKDIWWNVRGSGAGSMVAYALGITNLDPLAHDLIFERFLNPGRQSMPDFDLDYPEDRRFEMIEYCTRKYGEDKVAAIITFGTLGARAAIRDVGRALDLPSTDVDRIARLVPAIPKPPKIYQLLGQDPEKQDLASNEFIEIYEQDQYAREVIDTASKLEGTPRHVSTHAAGIIVADRPLVEYIPLHRPTKSGDTDDNPVKMVTQFPMETAESIGLLKIDFLGLSTLTIMRKACELIEAHHGIKYDMSNIPFQPDPDNPEITRRVDEMFAMLGRGESIGVFQLESSGMRQMLKGMRPKNFENIIAAISLYRPGPLQFIPQYNRRLHDEEKVEYLHPALEPIIGNTYGIIVYQEQIMQIAAQLFGYRLGEADLMRRAVSKKKAYELKKHRAYFIERGPEHGIDAETAAEIYEQIEYFANYGFNKSHAADYAVITCQTAYLKCHYPQEYMTALMSVYYDDSAKLSLFASDCDRMGIDILPPNVNYSYGDFAIETLDDGSRHVRFGLGAVKNVGTGAIEHIVTQRSLEGPFADLDDFLTRCDTRAIGRRALEALIRVGALDDFGDRGILLDNIERMMRHSVEYHKAADIGQTSLFDLFDAADDGPAVDSVWHVMEEPLDLPDKREQLRWEKEVVGFYVTDHPLRAIRGTLQNLITHTSMELKEDAQIITGRTVMVAGLVNEIRSITTRSGDAMAIVTLEDMQGTITVVMFPRTWGTYRSLVQEDRVIAVKGKGDLRNDEVQVIADEVTQNVTTAQADIPEYAPTDALAALRATAFLDGAPDDDPHDEPDQTGDIYIPRDEDIPPLAEDEWHGEPAVTQAPPPPPDPVSSSNGGTNGHQAAASHDAPMQDTTELDGRQRLIVTLSRTGDNDVDTNRLRTIYNIAGSHPGEDELCIHVRQPQYNNVAVVRFPARGINVCDALFHDLSRAHIDEGDIQVETYWSDTPGVPS